MFQLPWIPGTQRNRTHYQVLGISPEEQDPTIIEEAALRCSAHVRAYQLTHESEATLCLNQIAHALFTLLEPVRRREYDLSLGNSLVPAPSERRPLDGRDASELPQGRNVSPASYENPRALLIRDEGSCDVKLVCRKCARSKA